MVKIWTTIPFANRVDGRWLWAPMRRTTASLLLSGIVLIAGNAVGQQNTLKEQLV